MFSAIKCFRERPEFVLPDRNSVTMTAPFMRAYTELLVKTLPPARRARDGRDGRLHPEPHRRGGQRARRWRSCARTRAARPATASTAPGSRTPTWSRAAMEEFDEVLGDRPNQVDRLREEVSVSAADLLDIAVDPRRDHARGPAQRRQRRHPVHLLVAARQRRRRDLRADGGRGDGRDLALAGVAVDPPRRRARRRPHGHRGARARDRGRAARAHPGRDRRRRVVRDARAVPRRRERCSSRWRWRDDFVEFLTLPAYDYLLETVERQATRPDAQRARGQRPPACSQLARASLPPARRPGRASRDWRRSSSLRPDHRVAGHVRASGSARRPRRPPCRRASGRRALPRR